MIWKFFYSSHSGGDFGTLYQLRNKLNYTSVVSTPKNNVNACEDFLEIISAGLVTSAALGVFDRNSACDYPAEYILPGADAIWTLSETDRKKHMKELFGLLYVF